MNGLTIWHRVDKPQVLKMLFGKWVWLASVVSLSMTPAFANGLLYAPHTLIQGRVKTFVPQVVVKELKPAPSKPSKKVAAVISPTISSFDSIIQKHSHSNDLDWRLVASIIHTESRFEQKAISPKGAQGLMQIMPAVAQEYDVRRAYQPEENIRAGIGHFRKMMDTLKGRTDNDALRLSLAAYNAGIGHLRDAQNLAMKFNRDQRKWTVIRDMLLLLQNPSYYRNSKYGYCKGTETVEYVDRVMKQYSRYLENFPVMVPSDLNETASADTKPSDA